MNQLARFFAVLGLIAQLATPVGSYIFGFLLDRMPAHYLLLITGFLSLLVTIGFIAISSPEVYEPRELVANNLVPDVE